VLYPSPMTGLYDEIDLEPHEKLSTIIHDQLNKQLNIANENTLASNQDLIENYTKSTTNNNLLQVTNKAEGQAYNVTPELTDKDFKAPVLPEGQTIEGEFKDVTNETKPITSVSKEHFSDEELKALKEIGIDEDIDDVKPKAKGPKKLKSIDPFAIAAGGAGVSEILGDSGELVGEEITQSTIAQTLAKTAPKLAQTVLGKALPVAGAGFVFPTTTLNADVSPEGFARKDIDIRFGGIDQMDTSQEKQIYRDDPRLPKDTVRDDDPEGYMKSQLPTRDPSDPLSDEAYRKRFLEQSRRKAGSQLRGFAQPR